MNPYNPGSIEQKDNTKPSVFTLNQQTEEKSRKAEVQMNTSNIFTG